MKEIEENSNIFLLASALFYLIITLNILLNNLK